MARNCRYAGQVEVDVATAIVGHHEWLEELERILRDVVNRVCELEQEHGR